MLKVKYSSQKQFMEPNFFSLSNSTEATVVFVFPDNIKHVSQIICSEPDQKKILTAFGISAARTYIF